MEIEIKSKERVELIDITREIEKIISKEARAVLVFSPHTTTALLINENEPHLIRDIKKILDKLIPTRSGYSHDYQEGNADSHLRSIFIGNNLVIPVYNSKLLLGSWQSIFFVELDGPRHRKVVVREI